MKRFLLTYIIVLFSLMGFAQNQPIWVKKTPKPQNSTYHFHEIIVYVETTNNEALSEAEATEKAKQDIEKYVHDYVGNIYDVVYKDGQVLYKSRAGQSIKWPKIPACKWHNPYNKSEWRFLYQIADRNHLDDYKFETFQDCNKTTRKIYWRAGAESIFPGLGQIVDKKDYLKGACFFAGTAACIIGGLISDSYYQWNYNEAIKLHPGSEQDSYLDKADQWNKAEYGFFIAAGLCWAVNICDALFAPPKYSVTPYIDDKSMSLSFNVKF